MVSYRRRCGQSTKQQSNFVQPYCVVEVLPNHTYHVERCEQISVQNKHRLKPYYGSPEAATISLRSCFLVSGSLPGALCSI